MWQHGSDRKKFSGSVSAAHPAAQAQARYQVGIPGLPLELQTLRAGGLYCIVCDTPSLASAVTQQVLQSAAPESRGALIQVDGLPIELAEHNTSVPPHDLRFFRLKRVTSRAFRALRKDLDRALRPRHRTLLLLAANENFANHALRDRSLLVAWRDWLQTNGCTAIFIAHAVPPQLELIPQLIRQNDLLAGLVHLTSPSPAAPVWDVSFWRTERHVAGPSRHKLQITHAQLLEVVIEAPAEPSPVANGDNPLYLERAVLPTLEGLVPDTWRLYDDRESLYQEARSEHRATVVFAIERIEDLDLLANRIRDLRRERGADLKLIVVEAGTTLRYADEDYLIDNGASWFVPSVIHGHRLVRQLEQLQRASLPAALKSEVSKTPSRRDLRDAAAELLLPPDIFFTRMVSLSASADTALGTLVRLEPASGLTPLQATSQLRLRRTADAACIFRQHVYIFLSDCPQPLVNTALNQLFLLPFRDIFSTHTMYPDPESIHAHCQKMNEAALTDLSLEPAPELTPTSSTTPEPVEPMSSDHELPSFRPRPTRLESTFNS